VDLYASLFEVTRILLSEDDSAKAPEVLFHRVLEATGASRGFIVVREAGSFEQKFQVRFDRRELSPARRDFSRSLVRAAIAAKKVVHSANLAEDERFATQESVRRMGACAVIAAPLIHAGEVHGVVYLEHADTEGGFPEEARRFVTHFAELGALFLRRALEREALQRRNQSLERDLFARHDFEGIVTRDAAMIALLRSVAQVADADATVLVRGETGTGKELVARALHANSARRERPFVTLHTSALPGTILESELFGHKKGAFTGADRDRTGRIAAADGGTLFLDEVAEIAPEVQAKLLRFLQFGEIQPVGSDRVATVNVRVVAATHQDLPALIRAGTFRQDLYFRLRVVELVLPPLRDRRGDVPVLVDHFLRRSWRRPGETPRLAPRAERALLAHAWPGNVRELAAAVERACLLATGPEIDLPLLPPELAEAVVDAPPAPFEAYTGEELEAAKEASAHALEATFLTGLLQRCEGNVSLAARRSGIHRSHLQKLLAKHRRREAGEGEG
jgi:Nif-specific regulatory protein/two-component system response regulator HydG